MALFPDGQLLNFTFQVNPENVAITESEVQQIQNDITASIIQIVNQNQYGVMAWFEAGGYAKWSKAS